MKHSNSHAPTQPGLAVASSVLLLEEACKLGARLLFGASRR